MHRRHTVQGYDMKIIRVSKRFIKLSKVDYFIATRGDKWSIVAYLSYAVGIDQLRCCKSVFIFFLFFLNTTACRQSKLSIL